MKRMNNTISSENNRAMNFGKARVKFGKDEKRKTTFKEVAGADEEKEELQEILGRGKAQQGIFYGDLENGELEIGQVSSIIRDIPTASEIIERMVSEFEQGISQLRSLV